MIQQPVGHRLLLLEIPKANEKKELAAEALFAALHGIYKPKIGFLAKTPIQDQVSFEIAAVDKRIRFYVWVPEHLKNFVEGQIYAQYPTVQIKELDEDYAIHGDKRAVIHTTELVLTDNETLPIKTFQSFEVDPLAAITATMAKLDEPDEEFWIQIIVKPIGDNWHKRSSQMAKKIKQTTSQRGRESNESIRINTNTRRVVTTIFQTTQAANQCGQDGALVHGMEVVQKGKNSFESKPSKVDWINNNNKQQTTNNKQQNT